MSDPANETEAVSPDVDAESGDSEPTGSDPTNADPASAGKDTEAVTVEELVSTLESVTAERDAHLSDFQRVGADFANFRKQTEKRNAELVARAGSRLAEALLPVLDACAAAAQQEVEGVEPIATQLVSVLQGSGLEVISDLREPFDPNRHEAAMTEPGDEGQEAAIVAEVLRTGYAWNGRVLRAAMVKVKG